MVKRIIYVDEDKIQITFSSIVFNVKSINEKFGPLSTFADKFDIYGETNGKLFYLSETVESQAALYKRIEKYFGPLGLSKGEDYFYVIKHPSSEIKLEHPSCASISWLGGEIINRGNFLWFNLDNVLAIQVASVPARSQKLKNYNKEQQITFKVLDSMDPKPSFPSSQFSVVPYKRFILFEKNCLPVFIGTPVGIFPEEIIPEALEGQRIALFYNTKLPIATTIFYIINGNRTDVQKLWVEEIKDS